MVRLKVRGFHFYKENEKWLAKGVTYGPFRPDENGAQYPPRQRIIEDFDLMVAAGVNTVRLYTSPTDELARLAEERGLYLLIDVPWPKHLNVYGDKILENMCIKMLEDDIRSSLQWPNVLGVLLGNEIPPDIARWAGIEQVEKFLRRLCAHARRIAPELLLGFANFPSTEFLKLDFFDFLGFNVYLEEEEDLRQYLFRIRHLYPETPIILSETGLDTVLNGEEEQARVLDFSLKAAFEAGMAGALVFSWTDEWHTGGFDINDWKFGLLDTDRNPKPAFLPVSAAFGCAPQSITLKDTPPISVVVASYNGERTLAECLRSLQKLKYPDYEIIVVNDGSTDSTREILQEFQDVIVIHQRNKGLSHARNAGIAAARGEIVAFTDSDCFADPDWLYHVALAMTRKRCAGVGGPNLTPMESQAIHRTVAFAPGHATHVLLSVEEAEHVPGCNMAFWRSDLIEIGCFDPTFCKAGDDVDIIWRLQDNGQRILFAPGAFVWHHRRSTIRDYWKQQMGYGEAEALLVRKHPHRFNDRGQSLWRGVIYSSQELLPLFKPHDIHYGVFGSAGFQCVYERRGSFLTYFLTSLEWWLICGALLLGGLVSQAVLMAAIFCILAPVTISGIKAWRKFRGTDLLPPGYFFFVWLLWLTQPILRGWKRYVGSMTERASPPEFKQAANENSRRRSIPYHRTLKLEYWCEEGPGRLDVLRSFASYMSSSGWLHSPNSGWEPYDLSVVLSHWFRSRMVTAEEDHGAGKRLLRIRLTLVPTSLFWMLMLPGIGASALIAFHDTVAARIVLLAWILLAWILLRQAMRGQSLIASAMDNMVAGCGYYILHKPEQRDENFQPIQVVEAPEPVLTEKH